MRHSTTSFPLLNDTVDVGSPSLNSIRQVTVLFRPPADPSGDCNALSKRRSARAVAAIDLHQAELADFDHLLIQTVIAAASF